MKGENEDKKENGSAGQRKYDLPDRSFEFSARIVKLCAASEGKSNVTRVLSKQLLRSGTSITANIEESQSSQSEADFLTKYSIACKEARETHYWLRLLTATGYTTEQQVGALLQECSELIAILTTIIKKLKAKRKK